MRPLRWVREQFSDWGYDVSRGAWFTRGFGALRGLFTSANFFKRSAAFDTTINYDLARSLYRNEEERYRYGAGFVKPIVDVKVEFVGLPTVSGPGGDDEAFLNECIRDYWAPKLTEAMRDCVRDSKAVIRFYQPRSDNPLFSEADRTHGGFEIIPPESITITYDAVDKNLVSQAVIEHWTDVDERTVEEIASRRPPRMRKHQIVETITPRTYSYYDVTTDSLLDRWSVPNVFGFVPTWEIFNEYSSDLGGGISDVEAVMPFIEAFHDVLAQALDAHRYHSIPKVKFTVKSVEQFVKNNWPSAVDESGAIIDGAKISWEGHEILFFSPEEDAGFIEARSVLGDSKTLLDFLIDCVCAAAEVPRWALLINDTAIANTASMEPFKKMVERKRQSTFNEMFVMACKMALAANKKTPVTVRLNWPPVLLSDLITKGQAIQQLIMAFDVAAQHEWMADITIVKQLAEVFTAMASPEDEMALAANNKEIAQSPAPAPPSSTQALQLPSPATGDANKNGKVAIASTSPSRS